jgi:hypothetical protein
MISFVYLYSYYTGLLGDVCFVRLCLVLFRCFTTMDNDV